MIKGKFSKNDLSFIQENNIFEKLENYDYIDLKDFIKMLAQNSKDFQDLDKSLKVLNFLSNYINITSLNAEIIDKLINLIQLLVDVLNYKMLENKKEILRKELELSRIKSKSRDITAKADLLKKLNESLAKNKKKLSYLEIDYLKFKNQIEQIKNSIKNYKLQILDLNKKKKEYFSQINKITRDMDSQFQNDIINKINVEIDNNSRISNSERIKSLQKKARDIQYDLKQLNKKVEETKLKLNEMNPRYEKLENNYKSLLNIILKDENQVKIIRKELKLNLSKKNSEFLEKQDFNEIKWVRTSQEIEKDLKNIENELENKIKYKLLLDNEGYLNLDIILDELKEIEKYIKINKKELNIVQVEKELIESIDNLRTLDVFIKDLEIILNKFLIQINLKCNFDLTINENNQKFLIQLIFIRSKEIVNFHDLTTPEKVFFVISLYISIKIILNVHYIIFSNLQIHKAYNKSGSIFRTIRKLLPIFQSDENLKNYNLIFILSNLEMKKLIKNLKIINL
ncbi:MAG: hypothetical protein ACTSPD_03405 [Promethearchaeota archaeon]